MELELEKINRAATILSLDGVDIHSNDYDRTKNVLYLHLLDLNIYSTAIVDKIVDAILEIRFTKSKNYGMYSVESKFLSMQALKILQFTPDNFRSVLDMSKEELVRSLDLFLNGIEINDNNSVIDTNYVEEECINCGNKKLEINETDTIDILTCTVCFFSHIEQCNDSPHTSKLLLQQAEESNQ
jgi:hypothetical protein